CHLCQLLPPQGPSDPAVAAGPSARAAALHPDLQLLAEPGRALVRRTHHQVAAPWHPPLGGRTPTVNPGLDRHLERQPAAVRVGQDRRRNPRHPPHLLPATPPTTPLAP